MFDILIQINPYKSRQPFSLRLGPTLLVRLKSALIESWDILLFKNHLRTNPKEDIFCVDKKEVEKGKEI